MSRKTKAGATAPTNPAVKKGSAASVSVTTGEWGRCRPVSFRTTWRNPGTVQSKILSGLTRIGENGGNSELATDYPWFNRGVERQAQTISGIVRAYPRENLQDEFISLQKAETALEAAKKLVANSTAEIGCVIEYNKPIGVIDESDIVSKVLLSKEDPARLTVGDIMTKDVVMVDSNDPIDEVIDLMIDKRIKAVPILQKDKFYGVFTISDAAHHNKNILEIIGEHLQDLSEKKLEDFKKLKVKLWSYIRNISRNRKYIGVQKTWDERLSFIEI